MVEKKYKESFKEINNLDKEINNDNSLGGSLKKELQNKKRF